jgi:hypothetical protein
MRDIIYTNVPMLLRQLDQIEPGLKKALVKDVKRIAKDVAEPVKRAIPANAPLSGMNRTGRLSWNNGYTKKRSRITAHDVKPSFKATRSKSRTVTPLVKVIVASPAVAMLDMARSSHSKQGAAMLARVGGSASRYVWPAALKALPKVTADVKAVLEVAAKKLGKKLF